MKIEQIQRGLTGFQTAKLIIYLPSDSDWCTSTKPVHYDIVRTSMIISLLTCIVLLCS